MSNGFNGLRVTAFESRRANEIEKLILYHGGVPQVAPSMREVPLSEATEALEFARKLFDHEFDIVILMTGVGTRTLSDAIEGKYSRNKFIEALDQAIVVARGPKPVAALRQMGLKPDIQVPEPNTWRDILEVLDRELPLENKRIAVQEYGISNENLLSGLRERGAIVTPVPIYKWALPENLAPLRDAIHSIAEFKTDISLFTSSQQVHHLIQVANDDGKEESLREGFKNLAIGSIGPTTTETLNQLGFSVDYEPNSPKMGNLVREMARRGEILLKKKRIAFSNGVNTNKWHRVNMIWNKDNNFDPKDITKNSALMKACRLEKSDYTPVWLMRQAGRFLREYRELRSKVPFLELCKTPELAAEVTLMAVDRLGVDAAIIFADILLILEPFGIDLEFSKGDGPKIRKPIRSSKALNSLKDFNSEELQFVYEAVGITRRALDPSIPLIGFSGAPFTVTSYLIEGGGSRNYENTKALIHRDSSTWHELMDRLTDATISYLNNQITAGADVVQIFDSWVGCLSPDDYKDHVLPFMKKLITNVNKNTPIIHFGTDTASLLELMKEAGGNVIGLDWRVDLKEAWTRIGHDRGVQGNLDPAILFTNPAVIRRHVKAILDKAQRRAGHIFNLGHGVLPATPVDNVLALIDFVHEFSSNS
ncbi:uroporphyrinogen decarboxylase [Desulfobacterota bacterium AH_259_B03_O07]|nr:uroporphyrinogen decarboxylase [Desulfobacterota bacterium AH_259_B03_O07]